MSDDMATTIEREAAQRPGRPSPAAPEQPEPAKSGGNKRTVFIIMGVVLLGLVAVGVRRWIYSLSHVSTDNAQVDGHIIPILPKQALEAAEAAARAADAGLAAAQAALLGADARVAAARAARDQAALNLSYTRITAPSEGVVSKKSVEIGQLVQPGQPLMSEVPLSDVWVTANLKETQTANVTPGDPADFTVDAYAGRHVKGHVESLAPATGARFSLLPPDNATGNFTKVVQRIPVRIRPDAQNDATHPLRPGMSVVVTITTK